MSTGFFRTIKVKKNKKEYYKYHVRNKLLHKEFTSKTLLDLKRKVIEYGLLWGIVNIEEAQQTANENNEKLKDLQGRYGEQINE